MYPLKSIVLVVLICTSLCLSSQSSEEPQARLLVSKQVLNKLLVQNLDILVKYVIYNVGSVPATNVILQDSGFSDEAFSTIIGNFNVQFNRIPSGANITHAVVVKPLTYGRFKFSAAMVQYKSSENSMEPQFTISSEPGERYIMSYVEYKKKFTTHLVDWFVFTFFSIPLIIVPFAMWWVRKIKYEIQLSENVSTD